MDSHVNFMSQIDGTLVEIDIKFHDYSTFHVIYPVFFQEKHDMDFGQAQVMEFPWYFLRK